MQGKPGVWCACVVTPTGNPRYQEGPDLLTAGMRALVVYKFGVEVPDEISIGIRDSWKGQTKRQAYSLRSLSTCS